MAVRTSFTLIACLLTITLSNGIILINSVTPTNRTANSFQNVYTTPIPQIDTGSFVPMTSVSPNQISYLNPVTIPLSLTVPPVSGNLIPITGDLPVVGQIPVTMTTAAQNYNFPSIGSPIITVPGSPAVTTSIPISYPSSVPSTPSTQLPVFPQVTTQVVPISTQTSSTPAYGQITITQQGNPMTTMYSPNCAQYNNGVCTQCSFRFIRSFDNSCQPVNPLCATWDSNGACLTCYSGYEICQSGCIMVESCAESGTYDPNCRNTVNGVCQQCSVGYYFNQNGICTQVNPFCKTSNQGDCLSCYAGYSLSSGNCTVSVDPVIDNPYCSRWENGVCRSCSRFSWTNGTQCVPYDPMCSQTDTRNGNCLSCYSGYLLTSGKCFLNTNTQPSDLLCKRWNSAGVCVQCSPYSFLKQNMCVAVDSLCRTFDRNNGLCLTCYSGYNIQNKRCVVIPPDSGYQNTNKYCSVWQGTTCKQCAKNTYFNANRICTPVNPNCSTTSASGQCLSCYTGYSLRGNDCIIDNTTINVGNALCSRWNGLRCQQCATRTYNYNGICTAVNTLCNTWDQLNGRCLTCYNGYILNGNNCIVNNQAVNNNPLCKTFQGSRCVQCANRAYFAGEICRAVDNSCATWSSLNGQCQSCYNGFALQGGLCVQLPAPTAPNANVDLYCARSEANGRCLRCFYGFALVNGRCVADFKNTSCAKNPMFCSK